MDCEKLISLVEERKSLWNVGDAAYHNRDIAKRLWNEIGNLLQNTSSGVKTKWQYLRDTYRRELAKINRPTGSAFGSDLKWKIFKQMSFLHDTYTSRSLVGNVPRPNQSETVDSPVIRESINQSISECEDKFFEQQSSDLESDEQRSLNSDSSSVIRDSNQASKKLFKSPKKRPRMKKDALNDLIQLEKVKVAHLQELKNKKGDIEEGEDYFFLMSLLWQLRTIPGHKKLQTRIRLQQVLLECQTENESSTFSPNIPLHSSSEYSNWNTTVVFPTGEIQPVQEVIVEVQVVLGDDLQT